MYGFFWWDSFKKELDKGYLILIIASRFCSVFKDLASLTTKELMDVVK